MDDLRQQQEKLLSKLERVSWRIADDAFLKGRDDSLYVQMEAQAITEALSAVRQRRKQRQR